MALSRWKVFTQAQQLQDRGKVMGWWPFSKKPAKRVINDPLLKDNRTWIGELRDICEMNFDSPEEARRQIRHSQVEWRNSCAAGNLTKENLEGLESRAFHLLTCEDSEWILWLDNLDFWKAGWKPVSNETNEA